MNHGRHPHSASRRQLLRGGLGIAAAACVPAWAAPLTVAKNKDRRSQLILLGTAGGPTPKALRAAPAQALVVDDVIYLIDCGNGVARQMALAGLSPSALRHVFVTHHHSDHNADLGNVLLLAWSANLSTPVDCWGPPPLARMRHHFLALNDFDIQTRIHDEGRPPLADLFRTNELAGPGLVMEDERVRVTAARVRHPPITDAYAYRFDCPDRSIVFSGDTAPSDALVELAKDADMLVHEVMYLPALDKLIASEPDADRLRQHLIDSHTTTAQVGQIAQRAGVKTLVLSHFVPGGDPSLTDAIWRDAVRPHFDGELIIGRDLMRL
ncbi:MBL fold metallo-hydrolase [Pseudoxanthomonas dokdonensis]|uniref:Beta-lactamase n=1 Tax=Pseudoxanthomonas dokdonensis TaxID=344882 RepID=A0A0R0CJF9_9GAMM|nr:MBL fold metallo-hydrolase [Pseudoxanthomonas dokdonensis]KRG69664.1 beta-lactamase [Pseudoxanthomonas dokdonensis]